MLVVKKTLLLFSLLLVSSAFAQSTPSSPNEALYQTIEIYNLGRYDEAYEKFKRYSEFYALDDHKTIFEFMASKSLFKAGKFTEASEGFKRFITDHPGSTYLAASYLYLGHIAYKENRLLESATNYLKAIDLDFRGTAGKIAADNLMPMLQQELADDDLSYFVDNYPRSEFTDEIIYYQGKRHFENGRYKRAAKSFNKYLENYPTGVHAVEVKQLYTQAENKAHQKITIGVLAPISGNYSDYGNEIVNGVKLAFANTMQINGKEVELLIRDNEGSPVYTTNITKSLILEEPAVIIGPLRSESAVGASVIANMNGIPIITPTASEQGIAELGDAVYQVSPPAERIATRLADYAYNELGIKEFGIIAPGDFTGREVAKAFSQEVYRLGGEVLSSTFYELGETDFSNQIKPLRDQLIMRAEEHLALGLDDSTENYDGEIGGQLTQDEWRVHLGGLFLPGYPNELALLIPQIRYHIISTQYLGLDSWDSPTLIKDIGNYIDGSIFATDYHARSGNRAYNEFYTKYKNAYKSEPGRVAALAYDSARLVCQALESGASTAEEVTAYLNSVENYEGVSCTINFKNTGRANDAVSIFVINGGALDRLK